jgi:apolipoprotein D and lipocalin family protein
MDPKPRTTPRRTLAAATISWIAALPAAAAVNNAPPPARPVTPDIYSGRWYEIARTPNNTQKDCQGPTTDFLGWSDGAFQVVETCHRGGPSGPVKAIRIRAKVLRPPDYTRFRMSFLGGMVHQEYWILDHADDNGWALMGTPGGNYVWLLSRRPSLPPRTLNAAMARLTALGYQTSRLVYPSQSAPAPPVQTAERPPTDTAN